MQGFEVFYAQMQPQWISKVEIYPREKYKMIPLPCLSIIPRSWVHFPGITLSIKKQLCALTNIQTWFRGVSQETNSFRRQQ